MVDRAFENANRIKFLVFTLFTFVFLLPLCAARSFMVYNVSNPSQNYFIVNGTTGNVGIGTAVPAYPLDVQGTGRFTGDLYVGGTIHGNIEGSITTTGNLNMNGYDIYNAKNVNTTNLFASGNVGIGTTNPSSFKLQIAGNVGPDSDNAYNLGSSSNSWKDIYLKGVLTFAQNSVTTEDVTFDGSTGTGLKVSNSNGYVTITPLNPWWAHIYTDRPKFIFNKPVYSLVNQFSSYNDDLYLQRIGTTKLKLGDTNSTFYTDVLPSSDNTYDLGTSSLRWKNGYFAGTVYANSFVGNISANNVEDIWVNETGDTMTGKLTITSGGLEVTGGNVNLNNLNVDSGTLYVDSDNNRVGIGTSSPSAKLHVYNGYVRIEGSSPSSTDNVNHILIGGVPNSTVIAFPRIASSNDNAFLYAYQSGINDYDLRLYLQDDQDDSERFSIWGGSCNNGGCDPGTTNAIEQFYVTAAGNGYFRGDLTVNGGDIDMVKGQTSTIHSLGQISFDWTTGGSYDNPQYHGIQSKDENGNWADDLRINSYSNIINTIDSNSNDGNSKFIIQHESTANGEDLFTIDETGKTYIKGNVGIGTTNPQNKLNVIGDINATGDIFSKGYNLTAIAAGAAEGISGSGTTNYIPVWTSSSSLGNSVIYQTGGNIGIGTTSPTKKLDVRSEARIGNPDSGGQSTAQSKSPKWSGKGFLETPWIYANAIEASDERGDASTGIAIGNSTLPDGTQIGCDQVALYTNGAARLFVQTNGNVGIGTTSPSYKLDVSGSGRFTGDLHVDGTIYGNVQGSITSTGNLNMNGHDIYNANNVNATRFFQNGKQVIDTINAGGGISVSRSGSSATINHADTSSQSSVDNSGGTVIQDVTLDTYGHVKGLSSVNLDNRYIQGSGTSGYLAKFTGTRTAASSVVQESSGKIGIGKSPSEKLDVSGNIQINDGNPTGTYKIKGHRDFYAGDMTDVSTTSTTYYGVKYLLSLFNSNYGIKPRYVNVIARVWNEKAGNTTYINVTFVGCASVERQVTGTTKQLVTASIDVSSCPDGVYQTYVYLKTTPNGVAHNDLIEFYYVE